MTGCDFYQANCSYTKFFGGRLDDAFLGSADFSNSFFIGTNLQDAVTAFTNFRGACIAGAFHLDEIKVNKLPPDAPLTLKAKFPSGYCHNLVDMDTIAKTSEFLRFAYSYASTDNAFFDIPRYIDTFSSFLEHNGVGEIFIDAFRRLSEKNDTNFESVFLSYSMHDQSFADFLYTQLRLAGVSVWYAPRNIEGGKTIIEQVKSAIHTYDRVILILSDHSLNSGWVSSELRLAYEREHAALNRVLFPIRITRFEDLKKWTLHDADTGIDLAHYIRSYFIPDFSDWQDEKINAEVKRLVAALRKQVS
jgi:hypothetical protein